jgi:hypothetical protein
MPILSLWLTWIRIWSAWLLLIVELPIELPPVVSVVGRRLWGYFFALWNGGGGGFKDLWAEL